MAGLPLPKEIIEHILSCLPPDDLLIAQLTCQAFYEIGNSAVLWRTHCTINYKFWDDREYLQECLAEPATDTDWKEMYKRRRFIDDLVIDRMDQIVTSQKDRISKIQDIARYREYARDMLLRQTNVAIDVGDGLARRYYSQVVLGHLNRSSSIRAWSELDRRNFEPCQAGDLQYNLSAYDSFVYSTGPSVQDRYEANKVRFEHLKDCYESEHPEYKDYTTRAKATTLVKFLRHNGFTGVSDEDYQNLQNSFISLTLEDDKHAGLPLIYVVIYCCVANIIGLDARPCGYPYHVYAMVYPPTGFDLDGKPRDASSEGDSGVMYMDPFRSADEIPVAELISRLPAYGVPISAHSRVLVPASVTEMVLRTGGNISNSYEEARRRAALLGQNFRLTRVGHAQPNLDACLYVSVWAAILLEQNGTTANGVIRRRNDAITLCEQLQTNYPEDLPLAEKLLLPVLERSTDLSDFAGLLRKLREEDATAKPVKRRSVYAEGRDARRVHYRVGQVFLHKRYGYQAAIIGWDVECMMEEDWIDQMGVNRLERGRFQSFYHALVSDKSTRYVAEDNIEISTAEPSDELMSLAGRYFKRWDKEKGCFVSNVEDEYPDDECIAITETTPHAGAPHTNPPHAGALMLAPSFGALHADAPHAGALISRSTKAALRPS